MGKSFAKKFLPIVDMRTKKQSSTIANLDKTILVPFLFQQLFPVDIPSCIQRITRRHFDRLSDRASQAYYWYLEEADPHVLWHATDANKVSQRPGEHSAMKRKKTIPSLYCKFRWKQQVIPLHLKNLLLCHGIGCCHTPYWGAFFHRNRVLPWSEFSTIPVVITLKFATARHLVSKNRMFI